jgi:hypothetical protein
LRRINDGKNPVLSGNSGKDGSEKERLRISKFGELKEL